jgi:hypothetical protein
VPAGLYFDGFEYVDSQGRRTNKLAPTDAIQSARKEFIAAAADIYRALSKFGVALICKYPDDTSGLENFLNDTRRVVKDGFRKCAWGTRPEDFDPMAEGEKTTPR